MAQKKSNIFVNTIVLVVVTFVAVTALAVVNQITRGPIAQAEIDARAEVYKAVYADAAGFAEVENTEELIENAPEMLSNAGYDGCSINDVLSVLDSGNNVVGYVIAATSPSGYGGDIQVAVGITKDAVLKGVDIVSNSETAGLGSKCTEPEFKSQFAGKPAGALEYTKTGAAADNQIDAISGATITTNAVTEAVNAAIIFYQDSFAGGIQVAEEPETEENALPEADANTVTDIEVVPTSNDKYTVDSVKAVADNQGYIITVTAHNAYDGDLQIALGIGSDNVINSFSTIVCNETKALGGQCKSDEFAAQFVGMSANTISFVPSGAKMENNEIDAIASATITTNAVITAANGAVDYYNTYLKGE